MTDSKTTPITHAKAEVTQEVKQELDTLADKDVDSTDSDVRYMAYGARLRTALRAGSRYIAYVRCS
jgi:mitochondrial fission process protein 1